MLKTLLLILVAVFFAMNMGASGLAVSFAPSIGSNLIKRRRALVIFTICVIMGSLLVGGRVANTLSAKIIAPGLMSPEVILIILTAACTSLFLANLIKIPQSTSIVTVGSFVGAGLYFKSMNLSLIAYLIVVWVGVSALSYFITYCLAKKVYPPTAENLRFYEKFFRHHSKLAKWTLFTDYYSAFGIGTNNVANVVGPLMGANLVRPIPGFIIFSILFGLGAFALGKGVIKTVSKEIVPLGVLSASLVSLIVTTFIIGCSVLGLPAPYVQFSSLSILAIHTVKEEKNHSETLVHPITKKILKVWVFTPILSIVVSYLLLNIFEVGR